MSWWDTSAISSLATQAFKNAQQRIDKVLDIKDDEEDPNASAAGASAAVPKPSPTVPTKSEEGAEKGDDNFWSDYLGTDSLTGFTSKPSKSTSVSKPTARTPTPASALQTSVTTERTELKTSATSAFTVRSKRVESTLKKFNVNSDLRETSPHSLSASLETREVPSSLEVSVSIPSPDLEEAGEKTEHFEEAQITSDKNVSVTESNKKSAPLKLGRSLSKKKATEEEENKTAEEKAKAEAVAIEAQVANLLESENSSRADSIKNPVGEEAKTVRTEYPPAVVTSEVQSKPFDTNTQAYANYLEEDGETVLESRSQSSGWAAVHDDGNLEMVASDAGSGWEAEDIDIEELSDTDSAPGKQTVDSSAPNSTEPGPSVEVIDATPECPIPSDLSPAKSPTETSSFREYYVEEESEKVVENIKESVPVLSSTEPVKEAEQSEERTKAVAVEVHANLGNEPKNCDISKEEPNEDAVISNQLFKDGKHKGDASSELVQNVQENESSHTECPERLQVSFESSDTAEGTGDELSESSRTLTGEDFASSQEDNVDGSKRAIEQEGSAEQVDHVKAQEDIEIKEDNIEIKADFPPDGPERSENPPFKEDPKEGEEKAEPVKTAEDPESGREKGELNESPSSNPGMAGAEKKGIALVSSSYVKTMLEEAMVESVKDTDSHTSSTSDKSSEMVRIESGMNSGHTSGDEIDTTTSSDIEIISTPTPNGEYRQERPFDLSPLRHALSRTMRRGSPPGHKRSDSSSSGQSTWSKNGDDLLSAEGAHHREGEGLTRETLEEGPENTQANTQKKSQDHDKLGYKGIQDSSEDPLETQNLLKDAEKSERGPVAPALPPPPPGNHLPTAGPTLDTIVEKVEPTETPAASLETPISHDDLDFVGEPTNEFTRQDLLEKLAEMAEVLDARERKLVDLSKDNIALEEAKAILKNQLKQSEEAREAELEDLNTITEEFTARLADFEQRQQATVRERDNLKKQLSGAQSELAKKTNSSSGMEKLLREKDQQISELLEEGEKLSKQQLQSNNIIKKLRTKEKDNETLLKSQKTKLDQQTEELAHLRKVLDAKEDLEKKQIEAINQQNTAIKQQEAQLLQLKSDHEDVLEKARGLQAALDNSYKEISELHKAKAAAASETQTARLSVEMQAKQELQLAMERQQQTHKHEIEAFLTQVEDLQMSIVRQEREQGRREDVLRQEISDLQKRLQEAEERNQDLTQSVTSATRPLLRQIENLQSTYSVQSGSYEKLERNLSERLNEAQTALAEAVEKERAANERLMDIQARFTSVETQVSTLRQEKSRLVAQLEVEKTKIIVLEDAKNSETAQLEAIKSTNSEEIANLKKEKLLLENQIEMEKMKVDAERKKLMIAHEQLRDKELQLQRQAMTPSPRSSSRDGSIHSEPTTPMSMSLTQEEILEKTLLLGSTNGSSTTLYESLRHTGAATLMENLQSQLKLKEGEIVQLQSEIKDLEQTRESMARELVNLSSKNDELEQQLMEFPTLKRAHKEMDARYQALLQMYGEKVEEAEELAMDLHDIKDMYKAQIEELLKRVR